MASAQRIAAASISMVTKRVPIEAVAKNLEDIRWIDDEDRGGGGSEKATALGERLREKNSPEFVEQNCRDAMCQYVEEKQ